MRAMPLVLRMEKWCIHLVKIAVFFLGGEHSLGDFVPLPPANKMPKIRPFPGMTEGP